MFKSILILLFISTGLFAGGSHLNVGLSMSKLGDSNYQPSPEIGGDIMFSLDNYDWIEGGLSLNIGTIIMDSEFKEMTGSNYSTYGTLLYKVGFDFSKLSEQSLPFSLGFSAGYGAGKVGSEYYHGFSLGGSLEYEFSKNYGIGFSHEEGQVSLFNQDFSIKKEKIYFTIKFQED